MNNLRRALIVAFAVTSQAISSICPAQHFSRPSENGLLAAAKEAAIRDDLGGIRDLEPKALAAADADAERQGDRLRLHLKSGAIRNYQDRPECKSLGEESKCQKYVLVVHASSRGTFVVAKLYYESITCLLIDDVTGDETTLRSFPDFSPSGNRALALLINDEQFGFAVQIWRREGHKFVLEWSASPYTDGFYTSYELVRWKSERTLELRAETTFDPPRSIEKKYFDLHDAADGWKVVEHP
jgi:hypothetical protein